MKIRLLQFVVWGVVSAGMCSVCRYCSAAAEVRGGQTTGSRDESCQKVSALLNASLHKEQQLLSLNICPQSAVLCHSVASHDLSSKSMIN